MEFDEFYKTPHSHILANVPKMETHVNGIVLVSYSTASKMMLSKCLLLFIINESANITAKCNCHSQSLTTGHLVSYNPHSNPI